MIYLHQLFSPAVCCHHTEELAASGQVARPGIVPGPGSQGCPRGSGEGNRPLAKHLCIYDLIESLETL